MFRKVPGLRVLSISVATLALVLTSTLPAQASGPGPGHDRPNTAGINVVAAAGAGSDFALTFTGHTNKQGAAHGSIVYSAAGIRLSQLDVEKLAVVDAESAARDGCGDAEMIVARGQATMAGVGVVRVWVDLQDRPEGDRARIRVRAATDHGDDHGDDHGLLSSEDSHGDSGHESVWLHNSQWQPVSSVELHVKGYQR